jgi:hypothetical protein
VRLAGAANSQHHHEDIMSKTTINQALRTATAKHGPLTKWGRNDWRFTQKVGSNWTESRPRDFFTARAARARSIAEAALIELGHAGTWIELEDAAGTPVSMVREYVARKAA